MNSSPDRRALRVFLVDDAVLVRRRLAALLGALDGVEIVGEAEEPAAAFAGIGAGMADLVVTELHLSGGTGLELLGLLAQRMPHVVVMVLTNHCGTWFRRACLIGGAHYFFDKTGEFDLARNTIQRIAGEHRTHALFQSGAHHV
ncbi:MULTISPECIES: response regulator [unclassified Paraburkholderia]|uniref:response regulator n=1 Tax=unclassified Paraburkholderia TaxID=2615204 RepID=UPI000E22EBF0|nr:MULTISPECIES: response regulator [unclassified Paraburkholderia]REE21420.1 response regulator receiver domain-containing protein [Paraburkholderia sp. BL27I4N3]RKR38556.1 response regulator receiver domain-containing protein [Paraburkholderia sp. BL17N1]